MIEADLETLFFRNFTDVIRLNFDWLFYLILCLNALFFKEGNSTVTRMVDRVFIVISQI